MLNSIKLGFIVLLVIYFAERTGGGVARGSAHARYLSLGDETDFSGNQ